MSVNTVSATNAASLASRRREASVSGLEPRQSYLLALSGEPSGSAIANGLARIFSPHEAARAFTQPRVRSRTLWRWDR